MGMILGVVFRINYFASVWFLVLSDLLFGICMIWPKVMMIVVAVIAGMLISFWRVTLELQSEFFVRNLYGREVVVTGKIMDDTETENGATKVKLGELRFGDDEITTEGKIFVSAMKNERLMRGDEVKFKGEFQSGFGTYVGYMYKPILTEHRRAEVGEPALMARNWFAERIESLVAEPEVKLGLSYLLGMKTGLPDELAEQLRIVGLTHIVVASGAHLSILVEVARKIFGRVSRKIGMIGATGFIMFFMSMVGWTPSIMRAGIMAILTLVGWYAGRKMTAIRMILIVMAMTLMINPMYMIDLGWLLSFASYGGIMILGPRIQKYFYAEKKPGIIGGTVITTIAATMMTLPITLYYYGQVSLISVVANLLILPTLSWAMGAVFLVGVVAGVPFVETVVAFVATKILDFHIMVVEFFGGMTQFLVKIEPYQVWVFGIYGVIIIWLLISHKKSSARNMAEGTGFEPASR